MYNWYWCCGIGKYLTHLQVEHSTLVLILIHDTCIGTDTNCWYWWMSFSYLLYNVMLDGCFFMVSNASCKLSASFATFKAESEPPAWQCQNQISSVRQALSCTLNFTYAMLLKLCAAVETINLMTSITTPCTFECEL